MRESFEKKNAADEWNSRTAVTKQDFKVLNHCSTWKQILQKTATKEIKADTPACSQSRHL